MKPAFGYKRGRKVYYPVFVWHRYGKKTVYTWLKCFKNEEGERLEFQKGDDYPDPWPVPIPARKDVEKWLDYLLVRRKT